MFVYSRIRMTHFLLVQGYIYLYSIVQNDVYHNNKLCGWGCFTGASGVTLSVFQRLGKQQRRLVIGLEVTVILSVSGCRLWLLMDNIQPVKFFPLYPFLAAYLLLVFSRSAMCPLCKCFVDVSYKTSFFFFFFSQQNWGGQSCEILHQTTVDKTNAVPQIGQSVVCRV